MRLTFEEAAELARDAMIFCDEHGDWISGSEIKNLLLRGFFSNRVSSADRRAYADAIMPPDAPKRLSICPPLKGMARVYLAWLLNNTEES